MKGLAIIITLFLFQTQVFPQEIKTVKKVVSVHGFKKQVEYSYYKKGLKTFFHGLYITYYDNGKIESEKKYKNGKLDGLSKFYDYGKIKLEISYTDGKLNGPYRIYNNGIIESENNYKNDSIHGKYIRYYTNGQLMIQGYKTTGSLEVNKYGFDDGSYAEVKKINEIKYYNLYNSSGVLILTTKQEDGTFDTTIPANCPKEQFATLQYPLKTLNKDLEGIVILRLIIGTDGKLKDIESIKGFDKNAIEDAKKSLKKVNCYWIAIKNGVPIEHELIQVITYVLDD